MNVVNPPKITILRIVVTIVIVLTVASAVYFAVTTVNESWKADAFATAEARDMQIWMTLSDCLEVELDGRQQANVVLECIDTAGYRVVEKVD